MAVTDSEFTQSFSEGLEDALNLSGGLVVSLRYQQHLQTFRNFCHFFHNLVRRVAPNTVTTDKTVVTQG